MSHYNAVFSAPPGRIGIRVTAERVARIDRLDGGPDHPPDHPLAGEAVRQIAAWLDDPRQRFDLPLAPAATAFQHRLREALLELPPGTVVAYGELARRLGSSARAVGAGCGANPLPLVVPCHRVVAAHGIGGYGRERGAGAAIAYKRWLLAREGVPVDALQRRVRAGPTQTESRRQG